MLDRQTLLLALFLAATPAAVTIAQNNAPKTPSDNCLRATPDDKSVVGDCSADKTAGTGQSLSKTLSRSGGVITPPATGDASVKTPPPQGNTPIIAPPGTPGGNPEIQPK